MTVILSRARYRFTAVTVSAALLLLGAMARSDTVTWTGTVGTDWHAAGNWDLRVPLATDDVVIDGGVNSPTLDLSGGSATIASLALGSTSASMLTVSYGNVTDRKLVVSGNVGIGAFGTLTHTANSTTAMGETHRLFLTVGGDLTVDGLIDVTGKGYNPGNGPAAGLGAGRGGGGHGGTGGNFPGHAGGQTYGSVTNPVASGCGGSGGASAGRGGGVVRLVVGGVLAIHGRIAADGGDAVNPSLTGGGAAGSIHIEADTVSGNGTVSAGGGDTLSGDRNTGGGGGRIAVRLTGGNAGAFASLSFEAMGGFGSPVSSSRKCDGAAGTIYLKDANETHGRLILDNAGRYTQTPTSTRFWQEVTDASAFGDVSVVNDAVFRIGGPTMVFGSWSNTAALVADSGSTVTLAGPAAVAVYGSNAFSRLVCETPGKTVLFEAGRTQWVTNELILRGAAGNLVTLESTVPDVSWRLNAVPGSFQADVSRLAVSDSDAGGGDTIVALNSINLGGNTNWVFTAVGDNVWTGGAGSSLWTATNNWSLGRMPLVDDRSITIAPAAYPPILDIPRAFNGSLMIRSGAALNLDGNDLTIGGSVTNEGTLTAGASEILTCLGDITFSGVFNPAQSTLRLSGPTPQTFDSGGLTYYHLDTSNTVTFVSGLNAGLFRAVVDHPVTLTFAAGHDIAVDGLLWRGQAGEPLVLTAPGAWRLNVGGYATVRHVDVLNSDASPGVRVYAHESSDNGGNSNWDFGAGKVWTGTTTDWMDGLNWTPAGVPDGTHHVLIDGSAVATARLTAAASISGLTVAGFDGPVGLTVDMPFAGPDRIEVGGNVAIGRNAMLTHTAGNEVYRLAIHAGGDVTINHGGVIDVSARGFASGAGPGGAGNRAGGGHGGEGGCSHFGGTLGGVTYGSIKYPVRAGSGGSGRRGGGVVLLAMVGRLYLDGAILANGQNATGTDGGGAGGSVSIQAGTMSGQGLISAIGGSTEGDRSGGGAGGRISIRLLSGQRDSVALLTLLAQGGRGSSIVHHGAAGTIYIAPADREDAVVWIDNNNEAIDFDTRTAIPAAIDPGHADLRYVSLILTNRASLRMTDNTRIQRLTVATADEKLDLGAAGMRLFVRALTGRATMAFHGTVYQESGVYTVADWKGYPTPANVTNDGEILLMAPLGSVLRLR